MKEWGKGGFHVILKPLEFIQQSQFSSHLKLIVWS